MVVFEWQTSPGTRDYARNRELPTLTEHLRWFYEKLASADSQIWVGLSDGRPFGIVRLDRRDDEWEVSIVVAPQMRGTGLGKAVLAAIDEISGDKKLFAEVLPGNEASHALFRAAGYHLCPDGRYRRLE
jgi:UDP-2,4-diacetamido-2,4,6-trideoxy-beta-L-altropyranose hydrolase